MRHIDCGSFVLSTDRPGVSNGYVVCFSGDGGQALWATSESFDDVAMAGTVLAAPGDVFATFYGGLNARVAKYTGADGTLIRTRDIEGGIRLVRLLAARDGGGSR